MRIFLIGFMGSGKSTLGRELSQRLQLRFIDLDHHIEQIEGLTVKDIFAQKGEDYFRKLEYISINEMSTTENIVVATGGGLPCFFNNTEIMKNSGISIYLKISPNELSRRLKNGKADRPLIKDKNDEQLMEFIEMKLKERDKFYNDATYIVQSDHIQVDDLMYFIKK